ncbi:MAG TPA: glutamine--fructose-6-phosphate transaminase (isomerizing) [Firmicutes bacterium]|nr:glutamine--fructose-6-phosphate transaminase (isomerizing) [Bacillota bacterium]
MCGIVGYIGGRPALPILLDGLRRLEYRGYDSVGVAVMDSDRCAPWIVKTRGRVKDLEEKLAALRLDHGRGYRDGHCRERRDGTGTAGIGHTRWATHGNPSDVNSHPHTDCTGRIIVVHNGIIENFLPLRELLIATGHTFRSETDTEVIPHLLETYYYRQGQSDPALDLVEAVRKVALQLQGAYALVVMGEEEPDHLVAVRKASPLVIGLGRGENFVASDIPALLPYTRRVLVAEDGELAVISRDGVRLERLADRQPVEREPFEVTWDPGRAEKGGYAHFMLKEIHEQPRALRDTLRGRISTDGGRVLFNELLPPVLTPEVLRELRRIAIVACGTAAHAGLVGKYMIERLAGIPVDWDIASEYRYRHPFVDHRTLFVAVSQSGETIDTLAALREAKARGAQTLTITNVVGSTLARESDWALYTWAGPEIAVASTKAYTAQVEVLALFALWLRQELGGRVDMPPPMKTPGEDDEPARVIAAVQALPEQVEAVLKKEALVADVARRLAAHDDVFFIGRNLDYAIAMEGQLKLKEISYIHAEAYPAGELKHGTLALISEGVPVVAVVTQEALREKTISNIQEVRARGAHVIGLVLEGDTETARHCHEVFYLPRTVRWLTPVLAAVPLQLLAYYAAVARGHDVDKPRNLAKSVTVE